MGITGYEPAEQIHTIGKVRYDFETEGRLSDYEDSWQAHWPTASALAAKTVIGPEEKTLTFAITMDLPVTQFGMGRKWYKYYTENPLSKSTKALAEYAFVKREDWLREIQEFHDREMKEENGACTMNSETVPGITCI